jgi:hypothetical protein
MQVNKNQIEQEHKVPVKTTDDFIFKVKKLCREISTKEWSGFVVYSIQGNIEKITSNFEILLEDIILMDIGTSGSTAFQVNQSEKARNFENVDDKHMDYIEEYPERIRSKLGLIHSHNSMGVFFSHVDWDELLSNAKSHNYYLSVIVNNNTDICAKLAISTVAKEKINLNFQGMNDNGRLYLTKTEEVQISKEEILIYDCAFEKENVIDEFDSFFMKNLEKVKKEKEQAQSVHTQGYRFRSGYFPFEDEAYHEDRFGALSKNNRRLKSFEIVPEKRYISDVLPLPSTIDKGDKFISDEFIENVLKTTLNDLINEYLGENFEDTLDDTEENFQDVLAFFLMNNLEEIVPIEDLEESYMENMNSSLAEFFPKLSKLSLFNLYENISNRLLPIFKSHSIEEIKIFKTLLKSLNVLK